MFYLAIDWEIQVRTLHPDDAADLVRLVQRNGARLRVWIPPCALPGTILDARKLAIESFLNSLPNPLNTPGGCRSYLEELDQYAPALNPPMEMGIWVNDVLARPDHAWPSAGRLYPPNSVTGLTAKRKGRELSRAL